MSPQDGSAILDEILERMTPGVAMAVAPARAKPKGLRGQGGIYLRGGVWWVRYSHNGREIRESTKSPKQSVAERHLKKRLDQIATHRFIGPKEEKCSVSDLLDAVLTDHTNNKRRAVATLTGRIETLKRELGTWRAVDLRGSDVAAYTARRLAGKSKRGTPPSVALVNRELAILRRAYRLGLKQERVASVPNIDLLSGERVREGFIERDTLAKIAGALPEPLGDVATFAGLSGWRKQEILSLEWAHVDMATGLVRLARENSKTGEPRVLGLTGQLLSLMERRQAAKVDTCPFVFHRHGKRIEGFRKAWTKATEKAGVPGLLFHDLRRSACRFMSEAGVPQAVAMKMSGHKTDAIYRRYRIVSEQDVRRAGATLDAWLAAAPPNEVE